MPVPSQAGYENSLRQQAFAFQQQQQQQQMAAGYAQAALQQQPIIVTAQQHQQHQQHQQAVRTAHSAQIAAAVASQAAAAQLQLARKKAVDEAAEATQTEAAAGDSTARGASLKGAGELFGSDKKWRRAVDPKKRIYYWNVDTRQVLWKLPK